MRWQLRNFAMARQHMPWAKFCSDSVNQFPSILNYDGKIVSETGPGPINPGGSTDTSLELVIIGSALKHFPKHCAISSCIYSSAPEPVLTSCQVGSYKICESSMEIQNFLSSKCLVVCKMPAILFRFRCVNLLSNQTSCFTSALFICAPVFTIPSM